MNCDSVSVGFHFWWGKVLAELAMAGLVIAAICIVGTLYLGYLVAKERITHRSRP